VVVVAVAQVAAVDVGRRAAVVAAVLADQGPVVAVAPVAKVVARAAVMAVAVARIVVARSRSASRAIWSKT
jgi:hypothetical protein